MDPTKEYTTVLVVDDEPMILNLAADILKRYGYAVLSASKGEEAVSLYKQHSGKISAVVLDILMPDMDGREAFRKIREINPYAKIIVSSGYNRERDAAEFIREGANAFVAKPYRVAELVKTVGDVIAQK